MNKRSVLLLLIAIVIAGARPAHAQRGNSDSKLPLAEGSKWVLRQDRGGAEITIEVTRKEGEAFRLMFTSPWNKNQWQLTPRDGKVFLTGYGTADQMMSLPADTLFFDFTAQAGRSWTAAVGKMTVNNINVTVRSGSKTWANCTQITQAPESGSFVYTFAPGVGFVRIAISGMTFLLDETASRIAMAGTGTVASTPPAPASVPSRPDAMAAAPAGKIAVGVTTITLPNERDTPENLMKRFQQTVDAGIGYISGAGKWTDFEPSRGQYRLDSLSHQAGTAQTHRLPMSYTLRLIDTVARMVPKDLENKKWNDPEMISRSIRLIEQMAPHLKGRARWFMFGNEIDGYFQKHPNEVADFAVLYREVERRLKALVPGIQVGSTIMFAGIDTLKGPLRPLDQQWDFLSITYYPTNADFTVQDPSVPSRDFTRMREFASGRKVVLQEIGYPSSQVNKSSQDKQAAFFENVFTALRANRDFIEAGSFFLLADLRDQVTQDLTGYYGIQNAPTFRSFLQTLGMFDAQGQPKKSWTVFQRELKR
jgi:hypothetical protein